MVGLIWGALALSLLGSFHCMGMCGGFALLANGASNKRLSGTLLAYFLGKTAIYTIFGVIFGIMGASVHGLPIGSRVLSVLVGFVMIWFGLDMVGKNPLSPYFDGFSFSRLIFKLQRVAGSEGNSSRFVLGMLNGLLPCGLLYAAFAAAAQTGSPIDGGLFMLVFGLGTLPSLFIAVRAIALVSPGNRARFVQITGWLIVVYGIVTMIRGIGMLPGMSH